MASRGDEWVRTSRVKSPTEIPNTVIVKGTQVSVYKSQSKQHDTCREMVQS